MSLNLRYHSSDNGNCRVYYKSETSLYCLQMDSYRDRKFVLYACSRDGEPSFPVSFDSIAAIEAPKGDEAIDRDLAEFLAGIGIAVDERPSRGPRP